MDTHPFMAPLAFVSPTPTMAIRQTRNVDLNGKIYMPYLHEWKYVSVTFLDQNLLDGYYYFIIKYQPHLSIMFMIMEPSFVSI